MFRVDDPRLSPILLVMRDQALGSSRISFEFHPPFLSLLFIFVAAFPIINVVDIRDNFASGALITINFTFIQIEVSERGERLSLHIKVATMSGLAGFSEALVGRLAIPFIF